MGVAVPAQKCRLDEPVMERWTSARLGSELQSGAAGLITHSDTLRRLGV